MSAGENCSDVVHDFTGFMTEPIKKIMKKTVDIRGGGSGDEGF